MKSIINILAIAGMMVLMPAAANAYVWSSCARYASYSSGGYTFYTDEWGSSASECCNLNSVTSWNVVSAVASGGGVKSYPNTSKTINKTISNYSGSGSWNYSVPSGQHWDCSFDIWVPTEVMIWVGHDSATIYPRGTKQYSNVSIAGTTWDVWRENSSYNVISFVRDSVSYSGSVNIRTMLDYARVTKGWIGNGTIAGNGLGFEIFGSGGSNHTWTMNSCSIGS